MKKILAVVAFFGLCTSAKASYLYWQVDKADYSDIVAADDVNSFGLFAENGSTKVMISDYDGAAGQKMGPVDVTNYAGYSFYIELYNYSNGVYSQLGESKEHFTYSTLETKGFILDTPLEVTTAQIWHGGNGGAGTYVAPEPTTGLLMLFGLAGLALKRRKI